MCEESDLSSLLSSILLSSFLTDQCAFTRGKLCQVYFYLAWVCYLTFFFPQETMRQVEQVFFLKSGRSSYVPNFLLSLLLAASFFP